MEIIFPSSRAIFGESHRYPHSGHEGIHRKIALYKILAAREWRLRIKHIGNGGPASTSHVIERITKMEDIDKAHTDPRPLGSHGTPASSRCRD